MPHRSASHITGTNSCWVVHGREDTEAYAPAPCTGTGTLPLAVAVPVKWQCQWSTTSSRKLESTHHCFDTFSPRRATGSWHLRV